MECLEFADAAALARSGELHIFGYGSLIWRPDFPFHTRVDGYVRGYARRFWQASPDHRGTPEATGRVVTLVRIPPPAGGAPGSLDASVLCHGTLFTVAAAVAPTVLAQLFAREAAGYCCLYLDVECADGTVRRALTFTATIENEFWAGPRHWLRRAPTSRRPRSAAPVDESSRCDGSGSGSSGCSSRCGSSCSSSSSSSCGAAGGGSSDSGSAPPLGGSPLQSRRSSLQSVGAASCNHDGCNNAFAPSGGASTCTMSIADEDAERDTDECCGTGGQLPRACSVGGGGGGSNSLAGSGSIRGCAHERCATSRSSDSDDDELDVCGGCAHCHGSGCDAEGPGAGSSAAAGRAAADDDLGRPPPPPPPATRSRFSSGGSAQQYSVGAIARVIATARGASGPNAEYLGRLREALGARGVADAHLDALWRKVLALQGDAPPAAR